MKEDRIYIPEEGEGAGDKIVIEPEIRSMTIGVEGGIVYSGRGKVLSVEANVKTIKPGNNVTFDGTAGQEVFIFGKVLKILKESEVMSVEEIES